MYSLETFDSEQFLERAEEYKNHKSLLQNADIKEEIHGIFADNILVCNSEDNSIKGFEGDTISVSSTEFGCSNKLNYDEATGNLAFDNQLAYLENRPPSDEAAKFVVNETNSLTNEVRDSSLSQTSETQVFENVAFFSFFGDPWSQPDGLGSPVNLTYSYDNLLDGSINGISNADIKAAIEEAFGLWSSVAPLNFTEVLDGSRNSQIRIDRRAIGALGQASAPPAGDITLNNEIEWNNGLFLAVATHEIGHALGLGHEDSTEAIMNSASGFSFDDLGTGFLFQDDIDGIRSLYGSGSGSVNPGIHGTNNDDRLIGDGQDKLILGLNGNDYIEGGTGFDTIDGGAGNDTVSHTYTDTGISWDMNTDIIEFPGFGFETVRNIENVIGSRGDDRLIGDGGANSIDGSDGNDYIEGGIGLDTIDGGAGNDTVSYAYVDLGLTWDMNTDRINFSDGNAETIRNIENVIGTLGDDRLIGDGRANLIDGSDGNDYIEGGIGLDTIDGGAGNDTVAYTYVDLGLTWDMNTDRISFSDGNAETIRNIENVIGTLGDDRIITNGVNNTIEGAAGADTFVFNSADGSVDTIKDFDLTQGDRIEVSSAGFGSGNGFDYDEATGNLFFNNEQLANLENKPAFSDLAGGLNTV